MGKQSSKPALGARTASGTSNRARDPRSSHYQGQLASAKYFDEDSHVEIGACEIMSISSYYATLMYMYYHTDGPVRRYFQT